MTQLTEFPMYSITEEGNVYSHVNNAGNRRKEPLLLVKGKDKNGYEIVGLHRNTRKVHRLVATTFIPNPGNKPVVNHIDGDKANNTVGNLEWVTYKENSEHARDNGLLNPRKGEDHPASKLSTEDTIKIIQQTLDGSSNDEIAKEFGVHSRYVSLIRHQKRQKHIWKEHFKGQIPVNSNAAAKSKDEATLKEIVRQAFETTASNAQLGRTFNVDASVISRIRNNNKPTAYYLPYMEKYLN